MKNIPYTFPDARMNPDSVEYATSSIREQFKSQVGCREGDLADLYKLIGYARQENNAALFSALHCMVPSLVRSRRYLIDDLYPEGWPDRVIKSSAILQQYFKDLEVSKPSPDQQIHS